MKTYTLRLKGTKKNNTPDMEVKIFGDNKSQAFNYAYRFFELGEFISPYSANGLGLEVPGTAGHIEGVSKMMHLAGKYKVSIYSIK